MERTVYVGVDWGESKHAFRVHAGEDVTYGGEFKAAPEAIHEWARDLRAQHGQGQIVLAIEQSRGALIYALQQYDFFEIVPVNPRAASRYRESLYLSGAKDDPVDAELLCQFVRAHRRQLRVWRADDAMTRKLRLLVEHRRTLVEQRTSLSQALSATLKQYFPQILIWFSEPTGQLARAFVARWPTLEAMASARRDSIESLVREHSRMKKENITKLIAQIRSAVPLIDDPAIRDAMALLAQSYVRLLDALDEPIRRHDQEIQILWSEHPEHALFSALPGAGVVIAPRLAVAFGTDRERYADASEIQKYSGIAPVIERSGNRTWVHARFRCPTFIKQTFHEFAAASLPYSAWARAFYRQQRERGAGHHAAVRALAFRWIRVLFHCWKTQTSYDEQVHVNALRRSNSPLALRLSA